MNHGYQGKILEINLSQKTFEINNLSADAQKFIGGAGYNAWLLYQHTLPFIETLDPLAPENPLIFGAGPLVGTPFPTAARSTFTSISPLTGIFGDSNAGGLFGVMVKRSGYDHMVIKGASDDPCYIVIGANGLCQIENARDLWGSDTLSTEKKLKAQYPGAIVACIGPAGENLVRYACIMTNNNANSFSQAGMGAVMGSKKIKAFVVLGGKDIKVSDSTAVKAGSDKIKKWTREFAFPKLFSRYGTAMFINPVVSQGLIYKRNWKDKVKYNDILKLDIGAYYEATESKPHGCYRCPLRCGKKWLIKTGPFKGEKGHKYEVAYIISLGLSLGVEDVGAILHLVHRMNKLGIDIKEFSGAVGMAIDSHHHNLLDAALLCKMNIDWGNVEAFDGLIDQIAYRQGLGDILAEGTKKAAEMIGGGAGQYALHMKGMHWPGNSAPPFVLAFSTSTRGGDFLKGIPHLIAQKNNRKIAKQLFGATSDTFKIQSHKNKGRAVWWHENYKLLNDSLGTCFYLSQTLLAHGTLLPTHLADAFYAATGVELDGKELMIGAERGVQVQRAINALRGLDRRHDSFTERPESDSWAKGINLNAPGMLDEYYDYRGQTNDGLLSQMRLQEIGLGQMAKDLNDRHKLGKPLGDRECLSMETIVKNPSGETMGKGIWATLQNTIKSHKMGQMAQFPSHLRDFWHKQARKSGNA